MSKRIRSLIAKMASRMLAVQLELDPKSRSSIAFKVHGWNVDVSYTWCNDVRENGWRCEAHRRLKTGVLAWSGDINF